jgi:PKHD-type hydroxylase
MKGEWCYWMNAFSANECHQIIQMAKKLPEHSATIGVDSLPADQTFRRSVVRWIDYNANPEFTWLYDRFWKILITVNKDWFGFNVTSLPPLQFTEYDESYQGEYKSHQDVFWITQSPTHRKVSIVLQLTDPSTYEGGVLSFQSISTYPSDEDYKCMKSIGTIIAFPSFVYHRLEPVTKGKRYSLVAWFEGPKFQ